MNKQWKKFFKKCVCVFVCMCVCVCVNISWKQKVVVICALKSDTSLLKIALDIAEYWIGILLNMVAKYCWKLRSNTFEHFIVIL